MKNKVVWITGASSGIGEALAYEAAKAGARLVLSARRIAELERVKASCQTDSQNILLLPLDIAETNSFQFAVQKVVDTFGGIDYLINNAGISQRGLAKETSVEVDRKLIEVNYLGTVGLTKAVLPFMLSKHTGHITVITSAVGKFGSPWRSGYAASKHALHGFFDSLRAELFDDNIKVLLVCPGFVHTNVSMNALNEKGDALNKMDTATAEGLSPDFVAAKIIKAIQDNKEEIVIGGFKENLGIWMKRFFPSVFSVMVRKMAVR